jgi:hypothetical protein
LEHIFHCYLFDCVLYSYSISRIAQSWNWKYALSIFYMKFIKEFYSTSLTKSAFLLECFVSETTEYISDKFGIGGLHHELIDNFDVAPDRSTITLTSHEAQVELS